jgi:hypothetical protein
MAPPNCDEHGLMDLTGNYVYLSGEFTDYELLQEEFMKFTKDLGSLLNRIERER